MSRLVSRRTPTTGRTRLTTDRLARIMGTTLVGMGTLHFLVPKPFDEIIPEEIPADPRTAGVAEAVRGGEHGEHPGPRPRRARQRGWGSGGSARSPLAKRGTAPAERGGTVL